MRKNYITRGVGYVALLAAIIEQANEDLEAEKKGLEALKAMGKPDTELHGSAIKVIEADIKAWRDIVEADMNFNIYE